MRDPDVDLLDRCARARFPLPCDAVFSGVTALRLRGVDVGGTAPVRAATTTGAQTRRSGVRLARVTALPPHVDGVAQPAAAWRDASVDLDLVELVAAGDALVKAELLTLAELSEVAVRAAGRPWSRKVCARLVERGYRGPGPTFDPERVGLFERRV